MVDSTKKKQVLIKSIVLYLGVLVAFAVCMGMGYGGYTAIILLAGAVIGTYIKILPPERYATSSTTRCVIDGVLASVLVLLPYTVLLYILRTRGILDFTPKLPTGTALGRLILIQVVVVAIPEEYFFRGTLQPALDRVWNPRWRIFGIPYGPSLFVTSLLFGIAHLFTQGLIGLTTAIPALAFGLFYYRHRTIIGAVIFHAACNLLMAVLRVDYSQLLTYFQTAARQ